MKKLLAALVGIMIFASTAKATTLGIYNALDEDIKVAVGGTALNYNSLNAVTVKPKTWAHGASGFFELGVIKGPIRFAYAKDVGKKSYYFFETTNEPDADGRKFFTLPVPTADIRTVIISKATIGHYTDIDGKEKKPPVVKQAYPKRALFWEWPYHSVKIKKTTTTNITITRVKS